MLNKILALDPNTTTLIGSMHLDDTFNNTKEVVSANMTSNANAEDNKQVPGRSLQVDTVSAVGYANIKEEELKSKDLAAWIIEKFKETVEGNLDTQKENQLYHVADVTVNNKLQVFLTIMDITDYAEVACGATKVRKEHQIGKDN